LCQLNVVVRACAAIQASQADLSSAQSEAGRCACRFDRLRSAFVLVQVSLSFVLLAGTALLAKPATNTKRESGFSTDVLMTGVDLFSSGYNVGRAAFTSVARSRARTARRGIGDASRTAIHYSPTLSRSRLTDTRRNRTDSRP
jgi:hypothetical protein